MISRNNDPDLVTGFDKNGNLDYFLRGGHVKCTTAEGRVVVGRVVGCDQHIRGRLLLNRTEPGMSPFVGVRVQGAIFEHLDDCGCKNCSPDRGE